MSRRATLALHAGLALLLLGALLTTLRFGERIAVMHGLGWDGVKYGEIAQEFHQHVFVRGTDPYVLHRVLPSAAVHYALLALHLPLDTAHVVAAFAVLDVCLLTLASVLWLPIADALRLGVRGRCMGFVALFVNYAVMKQALYNPVMTDVPAFALGTGMLLCYLRRWRVALLVLTLAGAFTWPIAGEAGALLLILPADCEPAPQRGTALFGSAISAILAAALLAGFSYMYFVRGTTRVGSGPTIPVVGDLVWLSMAATGALVWLSGRELLRGVDVRYAGRVLRSIRPRDAALAAIAVLLPAVIAAQLPRGPAGTLGLRAFLRFVVFLPNTRPLIELVSHVIFYGPAVLLLVYLWPHAAARVRAIGPGLLLFVGASLLIALTPESRQSALAWPVFAALIAAVADEPRVPSSVLWLIAGAAIPLSRFWQHINPPAALAHPVTVADWAAAYRGYYMNSGPWMPNAVYVVNLIVVAWLASGVALLVWHARRSRASAPSISVVDELPAREPMQE